MAFVVEEIGRAADIGDDANTERNYYASGYATEAAATAAVLAYLVSELGDPPNIGGQVLSRIAPTESEVVGDWRCRAAWHWVEKQQPPAQCTASTALPTSEDDGEVSFDIGTELVRVQFALKSRKYNKSDLDPAPNPNNAINLNPKTHVPEGIDVYDPSFGWSETHYFHTSKLTREFRRNIMSCVGKTNAGEFRGNDAGEVLFMGVSGSKRSKHDYALTYQFKHRENTTVDLVGIEDIPKKGWEYVEVVYRAGEDASVTPKALVAKPIGAYIHKVLESADYDKLGIGN